MGVWERDWGRGCGWGGIGDGNWGQGDGIPGENAVSGK